MDAFEYKGYWWLPDQEEKKSPGTLSFTHDEGLRLDTFGSFSRFSSWPAQYPIMQGKTLEGKHFTLFDCASRRSKAVEPPDFVEEELSAEYAFESVVVGLGKTPSDSRLFHRAFVQYAYLPDWVGSTEIKLAKNFSETTKGLEHLELVYKTRKNVNADVGRAKVSIAEGFSVSGGNRAIHGVGIRPIFVFEIEAEQEWDFEDWREKFVRPLGDFLALATGQPNSVAELFFHSRLSDSDSSIDGSKVSKTIAYYSQITDQVPRKTSILQKRDMLFGFQDIEDEYAQVIQNWFAKREKFAHSMTLFFAIRNSGRMYIELEFLSLVQTLEAYHREIQVNSDKRVWLIKRLSELLERTQPVISRLVRNRARFARKVTDTRNFLTH